MSALLTHQGLLRDLVPRSPKSCAQEDADAFRCQELRHPKDTQGLFGACANQIRRRWTQTQRHVRVSCETFRRIQHD
jgi:hypothetical protein